jgi:hypothetical protein
MIDDDSAEIVALLDEMVSRVAEEFESVKTTDKSIFVCAAEDDIDFQILSLRHVDRLIYQEKHSLPVSKDPSELSFFFYVDFLRIQNEKLCIYGQKLDFCFGFIFIK